MLLNDSLLRLIERGDERILEAIKCLTCVIENAQASQEVTLNDFALNVQVNNPPTTLLGPAYAFTAFNATDVDVILQIGSNVYMIPIGGSLSVTRTKTNENALGTEVEVIEYLGTYTEGVFLFNYTY
jgi:hypothetical protein